MGQCAARGGKARRRGREGQEGQEGQDDIRELGESDEAEEEEGLYAGRDLVLQQTSRALRSIVRSGGRREWRRERGGGRERDGGREEEGGRGRERRRTWGSPSPWRDVAWPGAGGPVMDWTEGEQELEEGMDRVPAYSYGAKGGQRDEAVGENPCDVDYQTHYRYTDRNNQFLVKEVVKKPGCETFEIDFGDGLVTKKPSLPSRPGGARGGRRGRGGGEAGRRAANGLSVVGSRLPGKGVQRVSRFKRKLSGARQASSCPGGRTKDDIGPRRAAGLSGLGGAVASSAAQSVSRRQRPVPRGRGGRQPRGRGIANSGE
jgi:hypothetical protein